MLAKDAKRLEALRAIKSVILLLKTSPEGLTDESVGKALQKEVKKRKESAEIYKSQNRPDLEAEELAQAAVMEEYLPAQLSEDAILKELQTIIAAIGASGPGDLGKVMEQQVKPLRVELIIRLFLPWSNNCCNNTYFILKLIGSW